jgi:hypothetical protein
MSSGMRGCLPRLGHTQAFYGMSGTEGSESYAYVPTSHNNIDALQPILDTITPQQYDN